MSDIPDAVSDTADAVFDVRTSCRAFFRVFYILVPKSF